MKSYHVKKGDKVFVNSGRFRGSEAVIAAVLTKNDRVVLEFKEKKNIGKRTLKKSQANPNGGMVERSVSVHVSNVTPLPAAESGKKTE